MQLAIGLQLGESATHDVDTLLAEASPVYNVSTSSLCELSYIDQVGRLAQESPQLRLRTETLAKTLKTCELDSRANRYASTIPKTINMHGYTLLKRDNSETGVRSQET